MSNSDNTRRGFIKKAGLISAGITIIPGKVMSGFGYKAPSDKLNIAGVGIAGSMQISVLRVSLKQKNTGTGVKCSTRWQAQ
jgi:hypothetical protein